MAYTIGEFAKLTGLSIHTLRYYEQEQLLAPKRDVGNRRLYAEEDKAWVDFIKRLKATGMPIKEIRRYAQLRAMGDATLQKRLEMLILHEQDLAEQIRGLQAHQEKLAEKIAFYQAAIAQAKRGNEAGYLCKGN